MFQPKEVLHHLPPLQVRDWYVESFKELRGFSAVRDASDEGKFTEMLRSIYRRHANVVPVRRWGGER